jgi:aspartyl-tRNA(Asn)/glutamyl-tRNA(Gln) amidotransferase subunit A
LTELWSLGVEELVARIGSGELRAPEVLEAFTARATAVDAVLSVFIAVDPDAAVLAEGPGASRGGRLQGIPYAYKDVFAYRGAAPTAGVRGGVPLQLREPTATVLERLDQAGAVVVGRLNLDPYAYTATGLNPAFGDSRNPWDPSRISGGSSGGAAAAVAAGAVPFAIGTDAGGSLRIPAALCGVTGLKPTLGRVPKTGTVPLTFSQDTVGLLARSARDIAIVLEHVAGHDPRDGTSIPAPVPAYSELLPSCAGMRIGVDPAAFGSRTSPEVAAAATSSTAVLVELGAEVVEVDLSWLEAFDVAATVLTWAEAGAVYERALGGGSEVPDPIRARLELALAAHGADHVNAMRLQGRALAELLDGPLSAVDLLLVPTVASSAVTIEAARRDPVGVSVENLRHNRPFNFAGVPALALPVGFDPDGLPLGVQLVGRPWGEAALLTCAAAYQDRTEWHRRMPSL